jgi:tetratricopeptide (TPR) repeat protein
LLVASVGVFAGLLTSEFTFDDQRFVFREAQLLRPSVFEVLARGFNGHPIRMVTLLFDLTLFGPSPFAIHLHNLFWHAASVLLLYWTVLRLSGRVLLAFFTALLFAVHPIHVEAVASAWNRKEPLCLAFSLLSFLAYMRFIETTDRGRWGWLLGSLLSLYLALASKQIAIVLPISFVAYELLLVPPERRFLTRRPAILAGAAAVAGAVGALYVFTGGYFTDLDKVMTLAGYSGEATHYSIALTSARMFWRYLALLVAPVGLCPDHVVPLSQSLLEPVTLLSWLGLLPLVGGLLLSIRRWPLFAFGASWLLIHYLPVSNLLPSAYLLADRYMYVPSAGFCLAVVCLAVALHGRARQRWGSSVWVPAVAIASVLLVVFAAQTLAYTAVWHSNPVLMGYTLRECNPDSFRARLALGDHSARQGDHREADRYFGEAVERLPRSAAARFGRASARMALGDFAGAAEDYVVGLETDRGYPEAHYNLGKALFELGRSREAIGEFNRALQMKPDFAEAFNERGLAHASLGQYDAADANFEKAVELAPDLLPALLNLSVSYQRKGNLAEELRVLRRAAALGSPAARQQLAMRRLVQGVMPAAGEERRTASPVADEAAVPVPRALD